MKLIAIITAVLAMASFVSADVWDDLAKYEYGDASNAAEKADQLIQDTPVSGHGPLEAKLIGVVSSKDGSEDGKAFACRMLQQIGTPKSIPALAQLLDQEVLSHYARLPLERMQHPEADRALRNALDSAPDAVLAGLVGSIGERRDTQAVSELAPLLKHGDAEVVGAALQALAKIGSPDAVDLLARATIKGEARQQHLEALISAGQFDLALKKGGRAHRIAAIRGIAAKDAQRGSSLVLEAIKGANHRLRSGALAVVAESGGTGLNQALLEGLSGLDAGRQAALITAMSANGAAGIGPRLSSYLDSDDPAVVAAAADALGRHPDGNTVKLLLAKAEAPGVKDVLNRIHGKGVEDALAAALGEARLRGAAMQILSARGSRTATPALLKLTGDADANTRSEAWKGLASLGREGDVAEIMKIATGLEDPRELSAAMSAVKRIAAAAKNRDACFDTIAGHYAAGTAEVKGHILDVAAVTGNGKALALQRDALKSGQAALYDKAVRALAAWPNASASGDLEQLAKSASASKDRIIALRGYIRIAGDDRVKMKPENRLAMFRTADGLAARPDEKKLIIGGLRKAHAPESLDLLAGYMKDDALKGEAELSAIDLVWNLRKSKSDTVRAMAEQLTESKNKQVAGKARQALTALPKKKK